MSALNEVGGLTVPSQKLLTFPSTLTTSLTTLYTAGSYRRPTIGSVHFTNKTGGALTFDLVYNDGTTDFYLAKDMALPANSMVCIQANDDHFLAMEEGYSIKALASANTSVDCFLAIYESEGRRVT